MEIKILVEIVHKAQKGDLQAQQTLYIDSGKSVYYLALKILKDADEAEDITQDVFITVFEKISELKEPAAFYKWLNQITANKCMSLLRKKKPVYTEEQELFDAMEQDEEGFEAPDKLYEDAETRRLIMEIIDALPDAQRLCIMYRYFSQLSIEEVAAITASNIYTVKNRLAAARQKIRAAILEKEEKEGIRLHVFIPIMPILSKALDEFTMPEGVTQRMWQNIQSAATIHGSANNTPGDGAGTSGQVAGRNGFGGTTNIGKVATGMKMALGTKILIAAMAVVTVAALVTVGAFLIPGWLGPDGGASPVAIVGTPVKDGFAEEHEVTLTVGGKEYPGTYEGEYAKGLFNGYGIWIYKSFRYEGYFKDGIPNGEGVLTEYFDASVSAKEYIIKGNFINGYVDGTVDVTTKWHSREDCHLVYEAKDGYSTGPDLLECEYCGLDMMKGVTTSRNYVPPFSKIAHEMEQSSAPADHNVNSDTIDDDKGEYEGERDAAGLRSGYGVWVYGNYRYEGYWANGMPNGEGTLYRERGEPENQELELGSNYATLNIVKGIFRNGFADGMIEYTMHVASGDIMTWEFEVSMGYSLVDGKVRATDGINNFTLKTDSCYGGVPPWADREIEW